MKKRNILIWLFVVFALVGLAASIESTFSHYDPSISEFCNINQTFSCNTVNTSQYSEMFGIPVAVLGLIAYGLALVSALIFRFRRNDFLLDVMVLISVSGFLFSLYLTYIEAFVLHTWCLICVSQQLSILVMMVTALILRFKKPTEPSLKSIHE